MKQNHPKLAERFLLLFLKEDLKEEVLGDLNEKFNDVLQKKSPWKAKLNFWWQVINYLRGFAIRKGRLHTQVNNWSLLTSYLTISFRVFKKHMGYSMVNVLGLAIGISCSLFIALWVQDELKFNSFLEDGNRVYRVLNRITQANGEANMSFHSPYELKSLLQENYPIVENAVALSKGNWMAFNVGEDLIEWEGIDATPEFFEVFEVPFAMGGYEEMYDDPNVIAISVSMAKTYFGKNWKSQNVIGTLMENDIGQTFRLIGIYEDFPKHSTIDYHFVASFQSKLQIRPFLANWNNKSIQLYIKLREEVPLERANDYLANSMNDYRAEGPLSERIVFLQLFEDMYLHNRYENGQMVGGRIEYVQLLTIAAIFILTVACINFINISTARYAHRAKEIGVRKVLGAKRMNLRNQFLVESILMNFLAVFLALFLILIFLEPFNQLTRKDIGWHSITIDHFLFLVGFIFTSGILSGIYPAFYLSSIASSNSLKNIFFRKGKNTTLRKSLVTLQFAITIIMITGSLTVLRQVSYIQNKNIGLDRTNLIRTFSYEMDPVRDYKGYKEDLLKKRGIESVTMVNQLLLNIGKTTSSLQWDTKPESDNFEFYVLDANPDFLSTAKIKLKEGRDFSWDLQSDTVNYLINETAALLMDMKDPIGKNLVVWGMQGKIVGVIEDFHNTSLRSNINPLIIRNRPINTWMPLIRYKEGMAKEAIESIEEVFKKYNNPKRTLWFRFMDELYDSFYRSERLIKDLSLWFTIIAITISLSGLFSLVIHDAERRMKEVGIRKVLGASVINIFHLFSKEYAVLFIIAILIAVPISFFVMSNWLSSFAYRIDLSWPVFALGSVLALLLAYVIIGLTTRKAAIANPNDYLREE